MTAVAAVLLLLSCSAGARAALTNYTWVGEGVSEPDYWSSSTNWSGTAAPSGSVGTITFPEAGDPCGACFPADDISGVSAQGLVFDGVYNEGGDSLGVGSGGITVSGATTLIQPIALTGPQTWTVDGDNESAGLLSAFDSVTGNEPLGIDIGEGSAFTLGQAEVGPVQITGENPPLIGAGSAGNSTVDLGIINGQDGSPVALSDVEAVPDIEAQPAAAVGPLTISGTDLNLTGSSPAQLLEVSGSLTLDSHSLLELEEPGDLPADGPDAQLTATGPINLGSAQLTLTGCWTLPVGSVYPIISTTASLSGQFAGLPNGSVLSAAACAGAVSPTFRINYTSNAVTATVVTSTLFTTRTMIWGFNPSSPGAGAPLSITANVIPATSAQGSEPDGTVTFYDDGQTIPTCAAVPVMIGVTDEAVCQTAFAPAGSTHEISAQFVPTDPTTWQGSRTVGDWPITVAGGAVPTEVVASGASLSGLSDFQPALRIGLHVPPRGSKITQIRIHFPTGLELRSGRSDLADGVTVNGRRVKRLVVRDGSLTILLTHPASEAAVRIDRLALSETRRLARELTAGHGKMNLKFVLEIETGTHTFTRLLVQPAIA